MNEDEKAARDLMNLSIHHIDLASKAMIGLRESDPLKCLEIAQKQLDQAVECVKRLKEVKR